MAEHSRYNVSAPQAGIEDGLLQNKLGIKDQQKLQDAETLLLNDAYVHFFILIQKRKITFNLAFLYRIHKYFLGTLYTWAGKTRSVDLSKDGVLFAPVKYLAHSLKELEHTLTTQATLFTQNKKSLAHKLAIIHNESNAVHPFREGNGRTIRLFLDLIAVQAGYQPIDWNKRSHKVYIQSCKKGMAGEHEMMARIIYAGLSKKR